jgi:polyphosphate:AMP phosphotransferase
MFESAEVGNRIDKETYVKEGAKIREGLLEAQRHLAEANFSVILLIGGVEGAGKPQMVNLLLEWMDARGIQTHALGAPSDEERERPPGWRFWRLLPPHGRIGIFFGSWYTKPIVDRVFNRIDDADLDRWLDRIVQFEEMLHNENTLILKFWLHLSKREQKRKFKKLEANPKQAWRVGKQDWKFHKRYDDFRNISEHACRRTSTAAAPWTVVEATDVRYRNITVTQTILDQLRSRLEEAAKPAPPREKPVPIKPPPVNIINRLDMTLKVDEKEYDKELPKLQSQLNYLTRQMYDQQRSMILVFEGADAAGKGGSIRRLTEAMDARDYQVISVAAPTEEERAHPYLWRFWRHLPRLGRVTIYDRSWYGRVLVERVEGFCRTADWQRAYGEINAFEANLTDFGVILLKFWLTITPEEQLARFKVRQTTPYKQYKITEEDWRNRAKWDFYEAAACEMIEKTSVEAAPWVLVEANNKEWARLKVLQTVVRRLKKEL